MENENFQTSELGKQQPIQVKNRYDKVFAVEIECWCYGFARFPGNITGEIVHHVIREMLPIFRGALQHNYVFDLLQTAELVQKATRGIIDQKEIAFSILVQLPAPYELDEESQYVLLQIVDQAERYYGGVLSRMEKRWQKNRSKKPSSH